MIHFNSFNIVASEACKKHQLDKDIAVAVVRMITGKLEKKDQKELMVSNVKDSKENTFEKMGKQIKN